MNTGKTKKYIYIILGLSLVVGIAAIVVGYYLLNIEDFSPTDTSAADSCGCYYAVATPTAKTCADLPSKTAFEYRVGTVQNNGTSQGQCSVTCDTRLSEEIVGGKDNFDIISCKAENITESSCVDIAVYNTQSARFANQILYTEKPTITTTFKIPENVTSSATVAEYYKSFHYVINGTKVDIATDKIKIDNEKKIVVVSYQLPEIADNADKLTLQAFGTTQTNAQVTSNGCYRELKVIKDVQPYCKSLDFSFLNPEKIKEVEIELDGLEAIPTSISAEITLSNAQKDVFKTKELISKFDTGIIKLDSAYLYGGSNFVNSIAITPIDSSKTVTGDKLTVKAELTLNGEKINSQFCESTQTIPLKVVNPDGGPEPVDPGTEPNNSGDPVLDIQITNSSSRTCVERTTPNNLVIFTILVRELTGTETGTIESITNKLPLGFTYQTNSTTLDGVATNDTGLVTVTNVGSSQEVVWAKDAWTIGGTGNETIEIRFSARASSTALTGSNLNEVVIELPDQVSNLATLRSSASLTVAQSCTAPETALFDSTLSKVILSIIIIGVGLILYYSETGSRLSMNMINSPLYRHINLVYLKLSKNREYFENKVIEKARKKS